MYLGRADHHPKSSITDIWSVRTSAPHHHYQPSLESYQSNYNFIHQYVSIRYLPSRYLSSRYLS